MGDMREQYGFEIVDLRNHPQVMEKIVKMEQELHDLLGKEVALIAYTRSGDSQRS
jgi:hypothetical protein